MGSIFSIIERQEISLRINIYLFISRILSIFIGAMFGDIVIALSIFSFTGMLIYAYMIFIIFKYTKNPLTKYIDTLFKVLIVSLPFSVVILCFQLYNYPVYIILTLIIIFYLFYLKYFWKLLRNNIND